MKDDTKKLIVVGGAVAIAGYFLLLQPAGEEGGLGGGGATLLPAIQEAAGEAASITNIFPAAAAPDWGEDAAIWGMDDDSKKTQVVMDKYESIYAPAQAALDTSERLGAPTAADVAAYGKTKKVESDGVGFFAKPSDETLSQQAGGIVRGGLIETGKLGIIGTGGGLDFITGIVGADLGLEKNAREGVKDWFGPTGKKSSGFGGSWKENEFKSSTPRRPSDVFADHKNNMKDYVKIAKFAKTKKSVSGYTGGFNAAGGYSRVKISEANPRGVPGWKQVGAKKPTAAGQPDRY